MRKSYFTEAQIMGMIKEHEARMATAKAYPKHSLSQVTFYKYKSKYGGIEVAEDFMRRDRDILHKLAK